MDDESGGRMSRSDAQKFAQGRNSAGGCLKGVIKNLKNTVRESCTSEESEKVDQATDLLDEVYDNWSDNYESAKEELI